jgi:uncharacterized protein (DUF2236 family)
MIVTRGDLEQLIEEVRADVAVPAHGIYGPQSMAWKISKEGVLFLGGGRAALLQLAHPFVAHAVDQHSETRNDPLGRFKRTFDNVFAIVFGDLDAALRSARRVHAVHNKITGDIREHVGQFREGARYAANDAEALMWVHATLLDTAVQVYEAVIRPLGPEEKESYYRESKRFARLFGIPDSVLPADWNAFSAYFDRMIGSSTIAVGQPALEMSRFLFASPHPAYRPLFRWLKMMTAGLLPARLRDELELPFSAFERALYEASIFALGRTVKRLPPRLRYIPAYVRAQRRIAGLTGPDRVGEWLERLALLPLAPTKT